MHLPKKLIAQIRGNLVEHYGQLYLLASDDDETVKEIVLVNPPPGEERSGCKHLPAVTSSALATAYVYLAKKGLSVVGRGIGATKKLHPSYMAPERPNMKATMLDYHRRCWNSGGFFMCTPEPLVIIGENFQLVANGKKIKEVKLTTKGVEL